MFTNSLDLGKEGGPQELSLLLLEWIKLVFPHGQNGHGTASLEGCEKEHLGWAWFLIPGACTDSSCKLALCPHNRGFPGGGEDV